MSGVITVSPAALDDSNCFPIVAAGGAVAVVRL